MNRKAQSTGFAWVYGLITLFGLGVMYIVFNQVFVAHLVPTVKNLVNDTFLRGDITAADLNQIFGGIDKYMDFFHLLPFIIFFIVVIWMIVVAIRKERESAYE